MEDMGKRHGKEDCLCFPLRVSNVACSWIARIACGLKRVVENLFVLHTCDLAIGYAGREVVLDSDHSMSSVFMQ